MNNSGLHIKLPQPHAMIPVDDGHIRVFKYDDTCWEWETFTTEESFDASDWICQQPCQSAFRVTVTDA